MDTEDRDCATALIDLLPALVRVLMEALQRAGCDERLTPTQYRALSYLSERDMLSGELARWLGVTRSSVTATVDVLAERGLVERIETPEDRRQVLLRITPSGRSGAAEARAILVERVAGVLAGLHPEDRSGLRRGVGSLHAALGAGERCAVVAARRRGDGPGGVVGADACWTAPHGMVVTSTRHAGDLEAHG